MIEEAEYSGNFKLQNLSHQVEKCTLPQKAEEA